MTKIFMFFTILFSISSLAQGRGVEYKQFAKCESKGAFFQVNILEGQDVMNASASRPVRALVVEKSQSVGGPIKSVEAKIEKFDGKNLMVTMPGYWHTQYLDQSHCTISFKPMSFLRTNNDYIEISFDLEGYFIMGSVRWDDNRNTIEELVEQCLAFEVTFPAICLRDPAAREDFSCVSIYLTESEIPVTPHCM